MLSFKEFINENRGINYENDIKKLFRKETKGRPTQLVRSVSKGGMSAHDNDLSLRINGIVYNFELKLNPRAQMGSVSIRYNKDSKSAEISNKDVDLDDDEVELITGFIGDKSSDIDSVLNWLKTNDDNYKLNKTEGFPVNVTASVWEQAVKDGIIKSINSTTNYNAALIRKFYSAKNIDYIQIGKLGLFYMENNPLELDIPKLDGNLVIEFRAGKSGVKYNKTNDWKYSTIILRVSNRLAFKGKSDLSIDSEAGVKKFLDIVEKSLTLKAD